MTYGWAILVALVIVGILFFSGNITDPTRFMPEECEFYITVVCLDHVVEKDEITLSVKNEAEREIIVENIIATSDALDGQCELTGIHRGKHLKNGEDFLYQLNRTVKTDATLSPPQNTNTQWKIPNNQILLTKAHSDPDNQEHQNSHKLYNDLFAGNLIQDSTLDDKYKDWFNDNKADFKAYVGVPENDETLEAYRTRAIAWLDDVIANASARKDAAEYVSTKTNESNNSITKDYVWESIMDEVDAIFSFEYNEEFTIEQYIDYYSRGLISPGYDVTSNYNRLICEIYTSHGTLEYLNQMKKGRFNYAAYEIFVNAHAANADPALSREDLYNNLSDSIENVIAFYESYIPAEVAGVDAMAPIIGDAFKNTPVVSPGNKNNLHRWGDFCADGFTLDEIQLSNKDRAFQILFQLTSGYSYSRGEYVEYLSEDDFSGDAYCVLSFLVTDITVADDRGSLGVRNNFNNDGTVDHNDETFDLFSYLLYEDPINKVPKDYLNEVKVAVDEVASDRKRPEDYKYSQKFNGADLDLIIKIIGSEDEILGIIMSDPNFDPYNPDYIDSIIGSVDNSDSNILCLDYPDQINPNFNIGNTEYKSLLIFYLNTLYNPTDLDSRLYTRLYEQEAVDPRYVSFNSDLYYDLLYEVLIYDAARAVYNAGDRTDKANEIKEGVTTAVNLFVFGVVTAPHVPVRNEYTGCYDVSKLFNPTSGDLDDYVSHCAADYVRQHFYHFEYTDVLESGLDGRNLLDFFENTGQFYQERIQEIRNAVFDGIEAIEQAIGLSLPTPVKVCEAARRAALVDLVSDPDPVPSTALQVINDARPVLPVDCQHIPGTTTIFDILEAVTNAAGAIIGPAQEDRDAAENIRNFLRGWLSSQPPTISLDVNDAQRDSAGIYQPASASFTVNITATDPDFDLDRITIRIISADGSVEEVYNERIRVLMTQIRDGCAADNCQINDISLNAGTFLNEEVTLLAQVIDLAGNRATDIETIRIPNEVPPIIENFELIAVLHRNEGENYYTELLVRVNATAEHNHDLANITLDLPLDLNSHLNPNLDPEVEEVALRADFEQNVTFFANPPPVTDTRLSNSVTPSFPFNQTCEANEKTECVKEFTLTVSKELNNNVIWLTAKAGSPSGESADFNKKIRIPPESIPACQYLDIGRNKNRYDLKLIYAWAESPGIFHTITGTMLATSPE